MIEREAIDVPSHVADYEAEHTLPMLVGTTRQISWGRLIRHQLLRDIQDMMETTDGNSPEEARSIHAAVEWLRAETDSNRWIDHRACRGNTKALIAKITGDREELAQMEKQAKAEAAAILGQATPDT